MAVNPMKIGVLLALFIAFLSISHIEDSLGGILDTLPMRLAALMAILAVIPFDGYIALAVFMVIVGIYIHHHQEDLRDVTDSNYPQLLDVYNGNIKSPAIIQKLEKGGHADEIIDTMEFVSRHEDQDNAFNPVGHSQDEKHALLTEPLGERAHSLFPEDMKNMSSMEEGNRSGY
jgi:hypothetical protein